MAKQEQSLKTLNGSGAGFGTFSGVFTPSILTILGVIMYLRFGWVVGNVGLVGTLIIVSLSTLITFLTALSIASIATDQNVKTGGAYYMISRSLGIETGGAVGIPLFLAQALSVALYTLGFAESVATVFPQLNQTAVGLFTTAVVGLLALFSAKIAIRSQFFIMAAILLSLISLAFGKPLEESSIEFWGVAREDSVSFWKVFAVFFPAVTGIMAGVNMSGDLKNPKQSIPKGTFLAVGVGYFIYMGLPLILASRADASTLIADPLIMRKISFWGDAILLGVWGATLSSAIGSMLGAPRVLQALARDRVLPPLFRWLGKGSGNDDSPRAGTWLTLAFALLAVYFGNLNLVAPVLTMFFLTTYGVLNISAGLERLLGSPSFRPTFKVHWSLSLLGAAGCISVMLLINALATAIAAIFIITLFLWLQGRQLSAAWGDLRQGLWMAVVRAGLLRINRNGDPKNWRPHLLVLSGAPTKRWHLIELGNDFCRARSLMTVCTALTADGISEDRQNHMERNIREYLANRGINSLVRVFNNANPFAGAKQLVSTYGLGAMVPNTILMGASESTENLESYCSMIEHAHTARRNVLVVRRAEVQEKSSRKRIDIWWGGLKQNGGLMIILAHLLQGSINWQNAEVNLKLLTRSEKAAAGASENLAGMLRSMRVKLKEKVIYEPQKDFYELLRESSSEADLVMLGMAAPSSEINYRQYYQQLTDKTRSLPTTVFVMASQEIAFGEVLN
jgi:amino acid transporter